MHFREGFLFPTIKERLTVKSLIDDESTGILDFHGSGFELNIISCVHNNSLIVSSMFMMSWPMMMQVEREWEVN